MEKMLVLYTYNIMNHFKMHTTILISHRLCHTHGHFTEKNMTISINGYLNIK